MGRRSEHTKEDLQKLIIKATLNLVIEHGARNVTARQIARAVGYTPGMLYTVFVNLKDIFLHVNAVSLDSLYHHCAKAGEQAPHAEQAINEMSMAYIDYAEAHRNQFDLLFNPISDNGKVKEPEHLQQSINQLYALVESKLQQLAPERSAQEITMGARALWSGVHGAASLSLNPSFDLHATQPNRDIVKTLLDGFLKGWK